MIELFHPDRARRALGAGFIVLSLATLSGCGSTGSLGTFEEGGSFEQDILGGLFGAVAGGSDEEPIDYRTRAPLVIPPQAEAASLPSPQDQAATPAANWPNDADQARAARGPAQVMGNNAQVSPEELAAGVGQQRTPYDLSRLPDRRGLYDDSSPVIPVEELRNQGVLTEGSLAQNTPVDENGVPVRRYLIEPPSTLRVPSSNAPMEAPRSPGAATPAHEAMIDRIVR